MFTTTKTYDQFGRFVSHQSVRASDSKVLSSYGYTYNPRNKRGQRTQAHADATVTVQLEEYAPARALKPGGFNPREDAPDLEKRTAQTTRTPLPETNDSTFHAEFQVDRTATSGARTELDLTVTATRNAQGPNGELPGDAIDTKAIPRQIPAATVLLTYDDDGNLTSDDCWTYIWNGENRLIELQPKPIFIAGQLLPGTKRLEFTYDSQGRRIEKRVYAYNATTQQHDTLETITRFIYDGWLLIAELQKPGDSIPGVGTPLRTYTHGLDLSGTNEGAGGIAGLLFTHVYDTTTQTLQTTLAYCYDGNGNVTDLLNLKPGDFSPRGSYEYSPFGQLIRATGTATESNPFMFSTKYTDEETGFCYYGYRYYDAEMGRWINRDLIEEDDSENIYLFIHNNSLDITDYLGMGGQGNGCKRGGCGGGQSKPDFELPNFSIPWGLEGQLRVTFGVSPGPPFTAFRFTFGLKVRVGKCCCPKGSDRYGQSVIYKDITVSAGASFVSSALPLKPGITGKVKAPLFNASAMISDGVCKPTDQIVGSIVISINARIGPLYGGCGLDIMNGKWSCEGGIQWKDWWRNKDGDPSNAITISASGKAKFTVHDCNYHRPRCGSRGCGP